MVIGQAAVAVGGGRRARQLHAAEHAGMAMVPISAASRLSVPSGWHSVGMSSAGLKRKSLRGSWQITRLKAWRSRPRDTALSAALSARPPSSAARASLASMPWDRTSNRLLIVRMIDQRGACLGRQNLVQHQPGLAGDVGDADLGRVGFVGVALSQPGQRLARFGLHRAGEAPAADGGADQLAPTRAAVQPFEHRLVQAGDAYRLGPPAARAGWSR